MASVFAPRVVTTESDFRVALSMLKEIFTDPADLETDETFWRCFRDPRIGRYYLYDLDGACAGVSMVRIHPYVPHAMYGPYAGVLPEYRGFLTPEEAVRINETLMADLGVHTLLMDVEDPSRIGDAYPYEDPARLALRCELRLQFLQNWMGWTFIDDPELPYCRPRSGDPRQVQAYDLLGFYLRKPDDLRWRGTFNADRSAVSLDAYVRWYIELMQIEYGTSERAMTDDELSDAYPAVRQFLDQVRAATDAGKHWVTLRDATRANRDSQQPLTDD